MQEGQRKIPFLSVTSYHLVNLQYIVKLHYMIAGETHLQPVPLSASVPGHLCWHHSLFLSILSDRYTGTQGHIPHSGRNRCITHCKIPHTFYPKWNTIIVVSLVAVKFTIINGNSQCHFLHCCKGWKHTHHGQSHSFFHRSQENNDRCSGLLDPEYKLGTS